MCVAGVQSRQRSAQFRLPFSLWRDWSHGQRDWLLTCHNEGQPYLTRRHCHCFQTYCHPTTRIYWKNSSTRTYDLSQSNRHPLWRNYEIANADQHQCQFRRLWNTGIPSPTNKRSPTPHETSWHQWNQIRLQRTKICLFHPMGTIINLSWNHDQPKIQ